MARQVHTPVTPLGVNDTAGVALTELASNATDLEVVDITGKRRLLFIARNTGSTGRAITIDNGRAGGTAATATIGSGAKRVFGPFGPRHRQLSGAYAGMITFQAAHAEIVWTILNIG